MNTHVCKILLSIGNTSDIIATPWFSESHMDPAIRPVICQHDNNGEELAGNRNRFRSIAQFVKHWLRSERIHEEMKATNKKELKYNRHLLVLKIEGKNQENGNATRYWTSFQIRGKLKSKKRFCKKVSRSVESLLAYRAIASGN